MAIITFKDLQGVEHSVDLDGKFNVAFNCACETIMQSMPDNCVDLLCGDPPYGDGVAQSSQFGNVERGASDGTDSGSDSTATRKRQLRFHGGGKKDPWKKYLRDRPPTQQYALGGERERVARTGGTWAEKYGKKS